jgi:hypothetical protein
MITPCGQGIERSHSVKLPTTGTPAGTAFGYERRYPPGAFSSGKNIVRISVGRVAGFIVVVIRASVDLPLVS